MPQSNVVQLPLDHWKGEDAPYESSITRPTGVLLDLLDATRRGCTAGISFLVTCKCGHEVIGHSHYNVSGFCVSCDCTKFRKNYTRLVYRILSKLS